MTPESPLPDTVPPTYFALRATRWRVWGEEAIVLGSLTDSTHLLAGADAAVFATIADLGGECDPDQVVRVLASEGEEDAVRALVDSSLLRLQGLDLVERVPR